MGFDPKDVNVVLIGNNRIQDYIVNLELMRYNYDFGLDLWITTVFNGDQNKLSSGIGENTFIYLPENTGYGYGALDGFNMSNVRWFIEQGWRGCLLDGAWSTADAFRKEPGYREDCAKLDKMLAAYMDAYDDSGWEIVAVEETVISTKLPYSSRLDTVVIADGGLWIVEHKSTQFITEDLRESYQLDMQILGQAWLLQNVIDLREYPPFKGIKVNLVSTGHVNPRLERVECYPSKYHLAAFERAVKDQNAMRKAAAARGYPMSLGQCAGYARGYSRCQYYDLCHAFPQLTVDDWLNQEDPPDGFYIQERAD